MANDPTFWQQLMDAMPWNWRRVREREELERELMALDTGPLAPASSTAEAMEQMRRESRNKRASPPSSEPASQPETDNTELRERWRATGRTGASEAERQALRRKKGG